MIEIKDIVKEYVAGDSKVPALKGVSINFRNNEFVSILGPSGCGKTTLLNIMGGLDSYTSGDIIIDGVSTKDYKDRDWDTYRNHYIGFVFQSYNLIPHLSILENVELALSIAGDNRKQKREKALKALERVGLSDQIKKRPNQLSGGQMQRVAIARAIVNNPKIILADEPTGALDSETSVQVMDILKEISQTCLVVMVTHNGDLADKYSDRIINILDGELKSDSKPYSPKSKKAEVELKKKEKQSAMRLGTAFGLSFKNLISKKWKTLMISFAGSIGIIGIALVLAVSNGLNRYVSDMQTETLSGYPITVGTVAVDYDALSEYMSKANDREDNADKNTEANVYDMTSILLQFGNFNFLNKEFTDYVDKFASAEENADKLTAVQYTYNNSLHVLTDFSGQIMSINTKSQTSSVRGTTSSGLFFEGIDNSEHILENYDVLGGENAHYPANANEIALVISSDNSLSVQELMQLGIAIEPTKKTINFADIVGKEYRFLTNDTHYRYNSGDNTFLYVSDYSKLSQQELEPYYDNEDNVKVKISCVLRAKENAKSAILNTGLMYTSALTEVLRNEAKNSLIAEKTLQLGLNDKFFVPYNVEITELEMFVPAGTSQEFFKYTTAQEIIDRVGAKPFEVKMTKDDAIQMAMQMIGASDVPSGISFYTTSFDAKQEVKDYIAEWNKLSHTANNTIVISDATGFLTETLGSLIDIISYVLIAFSAISLVVSSIMIGIITYASVIERTKEIGVLRSIGARKKDIRRVFNTETFMIGLCAGLLGVLVSFILTFPISAIIKKVAGGAITTSMAILTLPNALILTGISVVLTLISGLIPASMAAKKDPVKALRTE